MEVEGLLDVALGGGDQGDQRGSGAQGQTVVGHEPAGERTDTFGEGCCQSGTRHPRHGPAGRGQGLRCEVTPDERLEHLDRFVGPVGHHERPSTHCGVDRRLVADPAIGATGEEIGFGRCWWVEVVGAQPIGHRTVQIDFRPRVAHQPILRVERLVATATVVGTMVDTPSNTGRRSIRKRH